MQLRPSPSEPDGVALPAFGMRLPGCQHVLALSVWS